MWRRVHSPVLRGFRYVLVLSVFVAKERNSSFVAKERKSAKKKEVACWSCFVCWRSYVRTSFAGVRTHVHRACVYAAAVGSTCVRPKTVCGEEDKGTPQNYC